MAKGDREARERRRRTAPADQSLMNRVNGKIFGSTSGKPDSFMIGPNTFPKRLNAASDCQTSTTRQPFGIGPAMCASTPFTGQSASLFPRPFDIFFEEFSYCSRVMPGISKMTPIAIVLLPYCWLFTDIFLLRT